MLEFVTTQSLLETEEIQIKEEDEESDDDFDWI